MRISSPGSSLDRFAARERYRSWFSRGDVRSNDLQVVGGRFEGLFSVVVRNKSRIVIESLVPFSPKAIQNGQQSGMFPVNALADKFDNGDVMPRLAASTKAVAEHKSKRSFKHRFISLLKTGFLVEGEDFTGRREFLVGTREEAINLRPVNRV